MKENRKRWVPLLMCGLLCALLLSGCSGMMQSLADGTDTVLGGLAEGIDRVAGALADGTDAVLGAAADVTDDSVKDAILNAYGSLVDAAGSRARTTIPVPMRPATRTFPAQNCSSAAPRRIEWLGIQ